MLEFFAMTFCILWPVLMLVLITGYMFNNDGWRVWVPLILGYAAVKAVFDIIEVIEKVTQ